MGHKSGYVNIVGNPNVGKSTLSNALIGEKLSIITSKAQTTRHRILGIVNTDDYQIMFSDTPGVLKPNYKLQESMLKYSKSALVDADIILYITDMFEKYDKNDEFLNQVKKATVPVLLVLNKIDLVKQDELEKLFDFWKEELPQAEIFPTSAKQGFNVNNILKRIVELLPEGPAYFDKDSLTDKSERFFVAEIIREKILTYYKKEIPYSVEIEVEQFKEENSKVNIKSVIHVARESQKGIVIGHRGTALKHVGTEARRDIEAFLGKPVFLELFVKVTKDWRDQDTTLKKFGYDQ
jgi:GTP-binding protein Era